MKKLLLLGIILLNLGGDCGRKEVRPGVLDGEALGSSFNRAEWEGHTYVLFSHGLTHDPDCPCEKK